MELYSRVDEVLNVIRPFLQKDGGDINLISVEDNIAKVQFTGFCSVCNKSAMTLSSISAIIKEKIPEIKEVVE